MNLLQLQYFLTVAKHNSVSKAANELFITQPALSKQIIQLEHSLNCTLFDRKNSFKLTPEGEIVKFHTLNVFDEINQMEKSLLKIQDATDSTITINILSASNIVLKIIDDFVKKFPDVNFKIIQSKLKDSSYITVFSTDKKIRRKTNTKLLLEEKIKVALPINHELANKKCIDLSELNDEPFILLTKDSNLRSIVDDFLEFKSFHPRVVFESNNPQVVQKMVEKGRGLTFIPEFTWNNIQSNLILLDISNFKMFRYIYLQIDDPSKLTFIDNVFINYLLNNFT